MEVKKIISGGETGVKYAFLSIFIEALSNLKYSDAKVTVSIQ